MCGSLEVKDSQLLSQLPVEPQIPSTRPQSASSPHPEGAWGPSPCSWLFAGVALEAWEEIRPGGPTPGRKGQETGQPLCRHTGSGSVSSGSPYTRGFNSRHPEQLQLGLPWPPDGWWSLTFHRYSQIGVAHRHEAHIMCLSEGRGSWAWWS